VIEHELEYMKHDSLSLALGVGVSLPSKYTPLMILGNFQFLCYAWYLTIYIGEGKEQADE
jgi:hypothetical protein